MRIDLTKEQLAKIPAGELTPFGVTADSLRWSSGHEIDLSRLTRARLRVLKQTLVRHDALPKMKTRIADIDAWLRMLDGEKVTCRSVKAFEGMLHQYLKGVPKHWLYEKRDDGSDVWQPYYVDHVEYHPPKKESGYYHPDYVTIQLHWEELGKIKRGSESFYAEDCKGYTPRMALALKGYVAEDAEKLASYTANRRKYFDIWDKVGLQFLAVGIGRDDVDSDDDDDRGWYRRHSNLRLDRDGEPARMVVDVLNESGKEEKGRDNRPSETYWNQEACDHEGAEDEDDNDIGPGDEDEDQSEKQADPPEVPLKPALVMFDLKRHLRLRVHVDQLTRYEYQKDLAQKLILPDDVRGLVDLLVGHRGGFKDIVGGKGTGAIVLCAGKPGTGKTLTSEVYSEAMSRPLYSVQCSQLGTDEKKLESELLKTFRRAVRWNAILLLDEADVYVAKRGSDLQQNAIVGVFLRVLEYYSGVMFLTTNRADLVDDAIASRCLARIDYTYPTPDNQRRIWRTLADTAGIEVSDREINKIVEAHPKLSGRDVKNLLKLAAMVAAAKNGKITADMVSYVKQFKPTVDEEGD